MTTTSKPKPRKKRDILSALGTTKAASLKDNDVALLIKEKTRIPVNTVRRVLKALRQVSRKYSDKGGKA